MSQSKFDDVEFRKFFLTVKMGDEQGIMWFLWSLALVIYFWAAATPIVWNDTLAHSIIFVIFIAILLVSIVNYTFHRRRILQDYKSLCSKREAVTKHAIREVKQTSLGRSKAKNQSHVSVTEIWYSAILAAVYAIALDRLLSFLWPRGWAELILGFAGFLLITGITAKPGVWLLRHFYRWLQGNRPWTLGEED